MGVGVGVCVCMHAWPGVECGCKAVINTWYGEVIPQSSKLQLHNHQ